MNITIHTSTVQPMIDLCKKHLNMEMTKNDLVTILSHPDYEVEFQRYMTKGLPVSNITRDEFIRYFMNINTIEETEIENPRLQQKHNVWKTFLSDIDSFIENNKELLPLSKTDILYVETLVYNSFPQHLLQDIGDIKCLFTLSIGNSMGYPYKDYIHFDFLNLGLIEDKEVFLHFIAHEIHHIVLSRIMNQNMTRKFTPLEYFLILFSYEGLAVKFCNNGTGTFTTPIQSVRDNIGMNKEDFTFFEEEFPQMWEQFKDDFNTIKQNGYTLGETEQLIRSRWMNPDVQSFVDQSNRTLSHYRNYYMGLQLYGRLYEDIGLNQLFELLLHPEKLVVYIEENYLK